MSAIKLYVEPTDRFGFVGDLHANETMSSRLDQYLDTCCEKLNSIGTICQNENVKYLFFAGDIFHRVSCTHECVNRIGNIFLSLQMRGIRLFSIYGNHDLLRNSLDITALARVPLTTLFNFNIIEHVCFDKPVEVYRIDEEEGTANSVKITCADFGEQIPNADKSFDKNILMAHMFFDQTGFLSGEEENIPRDKMEEYEYDMAFLGHDHEEHPKTFCGNTAVVRSGSLLRGTVHDYNFTREPGFIIVDDIFNPSHVRKAIVPYKDYQDIISQTALNRKTTAKPESVSRENLRNLAERIASAGTDNSEFTQEDVILKTIKEDSSISPSRRSILMKYLSFQ